jgi:hypothetical protein
LYCCFFYFLFILWFTKAYQLALTNISIINSNSETALNARGVISISSIIGCVIQIDGFTLENISINSTTYGAVSFYGTVTSLGIINSLFKNVGTGDAGGGIYFNITQYADPSNSYIRNCVFTSCSALFGGGFYVAAAGLFLYNINFTNNTAQSGSDIFENRTSIQSFYNSSTAQLCCSESEGNRFGLNDGSDKGELLDNCVPPSGERYISSSNSYDVQNTCLNQQSPCQTLANAILSGQAALEMTISVTVLGEYQDTNSTVPTGEVVHIHSPESVQSMCLDRY